MQQDVMYFNLRQRVQPIPSIISHCVPKKKENVRKTCQKSPMCGWCLDIFNSCPKWEQNSKSSCFFFKRGKTIVIRLAVYTHLDVTFFCPRLGYKITASWVGGWAFTFLSMSRTQNHCFLGGWVGVHFLSTSRIHTQVGCKITASLWMGGLG